MDRTAKSLRSLPQKTTNTVSYGPKRLVGKTSLKAGDEERIRIMNLVKSGEISIDGAVQEAEGLGVASLPEENVSSKPHLDAVKGDEVYNFGVHKSGKHNRSVKCVLQLDFPEHTVYFIQKGQRNMKYDFSSVKTAESEDGTTKVFISMDDTTEFELDANSFEDRNRIVRLLNHIIEQQSYSSDGQYMPGLQDVSSEIIKEGVLEKKGHNAAMLVWSKRFVRIRAGEILYFKVGDETSNDNALNVVQVGHGAAVVKKVDNNAFTIITSKREYNFRIATSSYQTQNAFEKSRDDWIIAFQEACQPARFNSVASVKEDPRDPMMVANEQEKFLKSAVGTLQQELEQLNTILNVVDAPFKASIQVRRVREIVQKLDEQVKTGLLSWTMRSMAQQQNINKKGPQANQGHHVYSRLSRGSSTDQHSDSYSTIDYHGSHQTGVFPNVSTVTHGYDFSSSRQAIINANRQERTFHPSREVGDHHSSPAPRNIMKQEKDIGLDNISSGNTSQLEVDQMYAKVNKEGNQSSSIVSTTTDDDYDDDNPPPLPPRLSSYGSTKATPMSICNDDKSTDRVQSVHASATIASSSEDLNVPSQKPDTPDVKASVQTSESPSPAPGIPPPPPPPPIMGGVPPPPPPPGINQSMLLTKKQVVKPNKTLKPFFWMKVPDTMVGNSFWQSAKEQSDSFDFSLLENIFQIEDKKPQKIATSTTTASKTLLDSKKAQNLGIFLSGFKIRPEEIESKLRVFNEEEGFLLEHIVALKRFQPNTDELELYRNFQGQIDDLPIVDKFMLKLCHIPNLNRKLDILLTIMEVPSQCKEIWPPVMMMLDTCRSLKESKTFEKLLEYILTLGNYINGGTTRGAAHGFKLSSLVKLVSVHSNDKEYNLLRYLVEQLFDEQPKALRCYQDIPGLLKPMEVSIKGLSAEVDVMKADLSKAQKSIESLMKGNITEDEKRFLDKAASFIGGYSSQINDLSANCKQIQEISEKLLKKFGEPSNTSFEFWLSNVAEFMKQLQKAVEDEDHRRKRRSRRALSLVDDNDESTTETKNLPVQKCQSPNADKFQPVLEELTENKALSREKRGKTEYEEDVFIKEKPMPSQRVQELDQRHGDVTSKSHSLTVNIETDNKKAQQDDLTEQSAIIAGKVYELRKAEVVHSSSIENLDQMSGQAIPANLAEDHPGPVKHGFLEKLSGGKKRAPKWDRRYFEVTSSGYLYYYKKPLGKLTGSLYLRGCPVQQDFANPLVILIESEDRDWQLRAKSAEEARDWVDTLVSFAHRM